MEIVKQSESFDIKDTNEIFEMFGNITYDIYGSLNLQFNINRIEGDRVGYCHYFSQAENGDANLNINCSEKDRNEVIAYTNSIIDQILTHFKTLNV